MFYYLKGNISYKGENFVAIDVNGAGYKVFTSADALSNCKIGEETTFFTHVYIREDTFDIYGFPSNEELGLFEILISISGVGPKAGLSVLSALKPSEIITAVVTNDAKAITKAQGVGSKLAQRIILELKGKISDADILSGLKGENAYTDFPVGDNFSEAINALISLGYSSVEARRAVAAVKNTSSVEDMIKEALKRMM